jgi:uncharacterized integral membrane protein
MNKITRILTCSALASIPVVMSLLKMTSVVELVCKNFNQNLLMSKTGSSCHIGKGGWIFLLLLYVLQHLNSQEKTLRICRYDIPTPRKVFVFYFILYGEIFTMHFMPLPKLDP